MKGPVLLAPARDGLSTLHLSSLELKMLATLVAMAAVE